MGMRREAGRVVRWRARAKRCPHAIHPFVRRPFFIQSYYSLLPFPTHKSSHEDAEILLLFWLQFPVCRTPHPTLHHPSPAARTGSFQMPQTLSSKLNLQWVCNRESTQDRTLCWKRLNTLSGVPAGMYRTAIRLRATALSHHPQQRGR